jgi:hypothetical protein
MISILISDIVIKKLTLVERFAYISAELSSNPEIMCLMCPPDFLQRYRSS